MAIVIKYDKYHKNGFNWNVNESSDIRTKLPDIKPPVIDYKKLSELCNIDGLKSRGKSQSTEEAHEVFMQNYKNIFVQKPAKIGFPIHSEKRAGIQADLSSCFSNPTLSARTNSKNLQPKVNIDEKFTFNIKDYLPLLHKVRKTEDTKAVRIENIKTLRQILRKHPFERSSADNEQICSILQTIEFFRDLEIAVLKELSVVAQIESWKEEHFPVYGKTGIHMILKGSVVPLFQPYLVAGQDGVYPQQFVAFGDSSSKAAPKLSVGDCFGTWLPFEDPYSQELSVLTGAENCEFLKFSVSDYKRVKEQIEHREENEKLHLLLSCEQYKLWPKQPLTAVAATIEWISYPPNTVLVSEGYKSPFIGLIRSGECHVLRQVEVFNTLKNGKKEQKTKQVVMGKLVPFNSFAEISVLLDEPMTCSVVTATQAQLGIIRPEKLQTLDDVTRQLLRQSNTRTFGHLTKEEIQNEYLEQELKREWNEFKHGQVLDVINARGIRPGYGKWSKGSPSGSY
ncbi:unnamed protein product [Lymnaea stagnalis]|uniref:Cyclic nucleotide-binding domain-containing protein n=1 Tax=Lymnaea stagnalis TaxID=6523 RepID=A0AAV2HYV9_LYMST